MNYSSNPVANGQGMPYIFKSQKTFSYSFLKRKSRPMPVISLLISNTLEKTMRRSRVAGIEIPPADEETPHFMDNFRELYHKVSLEDGFSSRGEYLHWDDFKRRIDAKYGEVDNKFEIWRMLKVHRSLKKHDDLKDHKGFPFYLSTPQTVLGKLFKVNSLSKTKNVLAGIPHLDRYLAEGLLMEEAISSAQLEGATTARKIAKKMLETDRKPRDYSEQMIFNNWRLIKEAESLKNENLSVDLICRFNRIATDSAEENDHVAGEIRKDPIYVKDVTNGDVIYEAPPCESVPRLLEMLCNYANKDHSPGGANFIDPILKAIVIHFLVGWIHPFGDGNGRTARALFYWFALKSGFESFRYISISALLKKAQKKYVACYVYTETDKNDLTYFVDYQLDVIIMAMERFQEHVKKQVMDVQRALESLSKSPLYGKLQLPHITILKKGLQEPGRIFTTKEIEKDFNVSAPAARKYLDHLVALKLLLKTKEGKTFLFLAPSDLKQRLGI